MLLSVYLYVYLISLSNIYACEDYLFNDAVKAVVSINETLSLWNKYKCNNFAGIAVVTRMTENIYNYSSFSFFLNTFHAHLHGYIPLPLLPDIGIDYKMYRKISTISEAFRVIEDAEISCKRNFTGNTAMPWISHVVWMDADAVVANLSFKFESVVEKYYQAEIIVAKDVSTMINTGVMILRTTPWVKTFLEIWRAFASEGSGGVGTSSIDQLGFEKVYAQLSIANRRKIKIVPTHELNTILPVMRTFHQDDAPSAFETDGARLSYGYPTMSILHMASEGELYRRIVFESLTKQLCEKISKGGSKALLNFTSVLLNGSGSADYFHERYTHSIAGNSIQCVDPRLRHVGSLLFDKLRNKRRCLRIPKLQLPHSELLRMAIISYKTEYIQVLQQLNRANDEDSLVMSLQTLRSVGSKLGFSLAYYYNDTGRHYYGTITPYSVRLSLHSLFHRVISEKLKFWVSLDSSMQSGCFNESVAISDSGDMLINNHLPDISFIEKLQYVNLPEIIKLSVELDRELVFDENYEDKQCLQALIRKKLIILLKLVNPTQRGLVEKMLNDVDM